MKYASFAFALGFLASGLASRPVLAATRTASFGVSVTVADNCLTVTKPPASGLYPASAANPASAVSVHCAVGTPYTVILRAAQAAGSTPSGSTPSATGSNLLLPLNRKGADVDAALPAHRGRILGAEMAAQSDSDSEQPLTVSGWPDALYADAAGDYPDSVVVTVLY